MSAISRIGTMAMTLRQLTVLALGVAALSCGTDRTDGVVGTGEAGATSSATTSSSGGSGAAGTGTTATAGAGGSHAQGGTGGFSVACEQALTADFSARDQLPQSALAESEWYAPDMQGSWGPAAATYPAVDSPAGCPPVEWKRARVIAAATHYVGLPYQHHHIPGWDPSSTWPGAEGPGLDCSNFTAWAYNYGIGVKFTSNVVEQANGDAAPGRRLDPGEPLAPADLVFVLTADLTEVGHAVLYVDPSHVIDSTGPGVAVRELDGWYRDRFSHARRVIE